MHARFRVYTGYKEVTILVAEDTGIEEGAMAWRAGFNGGYYSIEGALVVSHCVQVRVMVEASVEAPKLVLNRIFVLAR